MPRLLPPLALAFTVLAGPALAEPSNCDSATFRTVIHADAAWACAVIESRSVQGGGQGYTVRAVRDAAIPANAVDQHAARALDAIESAWGGYLLLADEFGFKFGNVTLVLPDPARMATDFRGERFLTVYADTNAISIPGDCVVRLNVPNLDQAAIDEIDATMAHELAHCVQGWSYTAAWGPAQLWWVESTAVLFQDMVMPNQVEASRWANEFIATIEGKPLTRQPYSGAVFFAWVAQAHRDALPGLLRDLASGASEAAHQATLRAALGDDGFRDFAHALVDGQVTMPSGFAVPPVAGEPGVTAVAAEESAISLAALPFTLVRQRLDVTGGTFRAVGPSGGLRLRREDGGAWFDGDAQPFGPEDCGDEIRYLLAEMPSDPAADGLEATTTRETACAGCAAPQTVDACLVGTWIVSNEAMADLAQANQSQGSGTGATVTDVSGTVALSLLADGKGQWVIDGLSIDLSLPIPELGGNAVIDIGGAGVVGGRWGAGDGVLDWCVGEADTDLTVEVDLPGGITTTDDWGEPPFEDSSYAYTCAGDALRLTYAGPQSRPVATEWLLSRR